MSNKVDMSAMSPNEALKHARGALHQVGQVYEEPRDFIYTPPQGGPVFDASLQQKMERLKYVPDPPSPDTERLQPYEAAGIYTMAWHTAAIFGVQPITDVMYASVPEEHRNTQLFCIVSRSNIKKRDSNLIFWPAVLVVVKEIPIVKVICSLDFNKGEVKVWSLLLWSNALNGYGNPIANGNSPIDPKLIPAILVRYKELEGIK